MTRESALNKASDYAENGQLQADLARLVTFETESQKPEQAPELKRYLTQAMQPRLEALGFECTLHDNADPLAGPFLVGVRIEDPMLPTVLTYGHGDVVRGQKAQWRDGLEPFSLVEEGEFLYGRGTADNKVQHLINIAALEAVHAVRGKLGFNIKIILEMGEEVGSPGLAELIGNQKELLKADVFIASDGPRLRADCPTMFMGARGGFSFDLSLCLREGAHHSGNWGGLLADPAIILSHAIACICDVRGQINIPEWRPTSLTPEIRTALRDLPMDDVGNLRVDNDWGEETLTPAERAYGWNSFTVLAMESGVPNAPVNAISAKARATCQLRYVVGTDPKEVLPALRRHLDQHGFQKVIITEHERGFFSATRLETNHPWVRYVRKSLKFTTGQNPHMLPNLAGSLPNECFAGILGLPTVWIPHSYLGCNQHAPDEHVSKPICHSAMRIMAGLFWDMGNSLRIPITRP